jgi:polyisoprenoid-binding protein YceI
MNPTLHLLTVVALAWASAANGADWKMDPAGSRLEFTATYEREAAPGIFKQFDTRLRFDPQRPEGSELHVTVALASADMNSSDVNVAIRDPDWFDVARFPQAEFRATDIRRAQPGRYLARGVLNLKGVKRELEVPFSWNTSGDAATLEGELTLNRTTFNIGIGEWATGSPIGLDIKVKYRVKLRRAG